ncbi:hypothetical protein CCB80_14720 [Armatimonadetes bacterium Uphvl-Ar1]|nr:hypothetical protein CCB80_14720 [Armatimonadetes bacterium Uphvl-Ar1]
MIGEALGTLISIVALVPIFAVVSLIVMKWTVSGDIDPLAGILTIFVLIGTMFMALMSKSPIIMGTAVIGVISLVVMFPFAQNYLDRHDLREINSEHIDRAFLELSTRHDNFPAWFKLADSLFQAGYHGHAIAIAEQTLERIPSEPDAFHNRSMRDMYRSEEIMIKKWRIEATNPKRHMPVACPKCGAKNRPGLINCINCEAPYLLLLSRKVGTRSGAFAKLVIGWALIALLLPAAAYSSIAFPGVGLLGVVAIIGVIGGVLAWIFRDPSGQPDKFRSFS